MRGSRTAILFRCAPRATNQQNDDMCWITALVGLIAAPIPVVVIYGMNFAHILELGGMFG